MRIAGALGAVLLGALAAHAELVAPGACGPVDRRHDHVEVLGATLQGLGKTPVAHFGVVAFRGGEAVAIPFEIDERRGRKVMVRGPEVEETDHRPGQFDFDDGVVFMPCDAGERPADDVRDAYFARIGAIHWREVQIDDPLTGRRAFAYVVVAETPPATTRRYIEYDERDVVRTASYRIAMDQALPARFFLPGLGDRNLLDGLRLRARVTWLANLMGTTITEGDARHTLLAWHDGPIRAVRRSQHDVHVALGIHLSAGVATTYFYAVHLGGPGRMRLPISPGSLFSRVSASAGVDLSGLDGWRYHAPGGETLRIDGTPSPEEARFDALGSWFLMVGKHEALLTALKLSPNLTRALPVHLVYADDATRSDPPEASRGSVPLVGFRADAIEALPAGYYEFEFRVFVLPDYRPGDERRVLEGFKTPLRVSVTPPPRREDAPAARP
ncbi:MAG TPA: hypothetical protein VNO26_01860 [Candidatus Limnocylindria bacterium]|nr:hypothetical protein [Candidatus Limnocylindria bacterium]